jgi:hypothetical protein
MAHRGSNDKTAVEVMPFMIRVLLSSLASYPVTCISHTGGMWKFEVM